MKTKKYLDVKIQRKNGSWFNNPLKLSEAHLISKIAQENQKIIIYSAECNLSHYKYLFG
jgi:hypothetical protein